MDREANEEKRQVNENNLTEIEKEEKEYKGVERFWGAGDSVYL